MGNKNTMIDEAFKRDERKRKAGKSRVMSFSQREASLMNNLSAQGGRSKKKLVMEGTEKTTKHKKREETTACLPSERDEGYLL